MTPLQLPNDTLAKQISHVCQAVFGELEDTVRTVGAEATPEAAQLYRQAIGKVLGDLVLDVMGPLYAAHPNVKPESWKDIQL